MWFFQRPAPRTTCSAETLRTFAIDGSVRSGNNLTSGTGTVRPGTKPHRKDGRKNDHGYVSFRDGGILDVPHVCRVSVDRYDYFYTERTRSSAVGATWPDVIKKEPGRKHTVSPLTVTTGANTLRAYVRFSRPESLSVRFKISRRATHVHERCPPRSISPRSSCSARVRLVSCR